ncbi:hypothetical protein [Methylobacterium sp. J-067]|uniref:hypothetical protein n=1 Tax=Methylobacterium sp. J-067 TaxID=2836648 RepID=UPI001FBA1125|nr:hypothetical protein [Methylobacterium sp. J-067]MCJ2023936.1 hypothetical protein [Methylobacterium sp. J-067]
MIAPSDRFGPWASGLDAAERKARLRAMRALARVHCGPRAADLVRLLAQAEADPAALEPALAALDRLAANDLRHILASYSALSRSAA